MPATPNSPTPEEAFLVRAFEAMLDGTAAGYIMHLRSLDYPVSFDEDDSPANELPDAEFDTTDDEDPEDIVLRDSALN